MNEKMNIENVGPPDPPRQDALPLPMLPPCPVDFWTVPATIAVNNFTHKSLSSWAFNIAVGCSHACRFCYVPDASTIKLAQPLAKFGVRDPDAQWGDYLLLRPWDETAFLRSLRSAENTPGAQLKQDGNRAVIQLQYDRCMPGDSTPQSGPPRAAGAARPVSRPALAGTHPRSLHA
jgi:hypothetical protein